MEESESRWQELSRRFFLFTGGSGMGQGLWKSRESGLNGIIQDEHLFALAVSSWKPLP